MKLLKSKAREIGVEVWNYLAKHPELDYKQKLPHRLYKKISNMKCYCPLCELFYQPDAICPGCPLKNCKDYNSDYTKWANSLTNRTRAKYAAIIRDKIKAW